MALSIATGPGARNIASRPPGGPAVVDVLRRLASATPPPAASPASSSPCASLSSGLSTKPCLNISRALSHPCCWRYASTNCRSRLPSGRYLPRLLGPATGGGDCDILPRYRRSAGRDCNGQLLADDLSQVATTGLTNLVPLATDFGEGREGRVSVIRTFLFFFNSVYHRNPSSTTSDRIC